MERVEGVETQAHASHLVTQHEGNNEVVCQSCCTLEQLFVLEAGKCKTTFVVR